MNDQVKHPSMEYCKHPGKGFGVEFTNLSPEAQDDLLGLVRNHYTTSKEYQLCRDSGALYGGHDEKSGWVYIEFWSEQQQQIMAVEHLFDVFTEHYPEGRTDGLYRLPGFEYPNAPDDQQRISVAWRLASSCDKAKELATKDFGKSEADIDAFLELHGKADEDVVADLNRAIGVAACPYSIIQAKEIVSKAGRKDHRAFVSKQFSLGKVGAELLLFLCE